VDQVYLSVPSQSLRENLKALRPLLADSDAKIISLMKGVERGTGLRMSPGDPSRSCAATPIASP
jgi:glycerol-3-phosphate dehydrogenase (NAD(P)+)